jgi:hypothetical protein
VVGEVLAPTLREAVDSGEVRMLFVLSDFEELEPRAWIEAWMTPGEVKVFDLDQEDEARAWVAASDRGRGTGLENFMVPSSTGPRRSIRRSTG